MVVSITSVFEIEKEKERKKKNANLMPARLVILREYLTVLKCGRIGCLMHI